MEVIDAEEVLDLLLGCLHLSKEQIEFIKNIFGDIWDELRRLLCVIFSSFRPIDFTKIEVAAENIQTIIDYFSRENGQRQTFLDIFPHWKKQREGSIKDLSEIADTIQQSKKICSTVQIVGGSIGIVGGACLIASVLFPPAAFVLPIWLGGAAVTALIPAALLPAAATSGLAAGAAIGGGIAAGAGAATQVATSVTELAILRSQVEKAKEACQKDGAEFERMMTWFRWTKQLEDALQKLFGANVVMDALFGGLASFCGLQDEDPENAEKSLVKNLLDFVKIASTFAHLPGCGFSQYSPVLQAAILAVLAGAVLCERRNRFCVIGVQRLGIGIVASVEAGVEAGVEIGRLVASAFVDSAHLVPRAVATKVAVGLLAGVGIALDAMNVVLNSIDLAEGSKSVEQDKILEVMKKLKEEMETLEKVHRKLNVIFHGLAM